MDCGTCPLSLTCLRGALQPEPCDVCDRILVHAPPDPESELTKKRIVVYVIRCPIDSPTREYIHDQDIRAGCCPGCAPRLWAITVPKLTAHILDPRDPETSCPPPTTSPSS
jgi:hypothetical protein